MRCGGFLGGAHHFKVSIVSTCTVVCNRHLSLSEKPTPHFPPSGPTHLLSLPVPDISYKWNHRRCRLLCLASFAERRVFQVHPCGQVSVLHPFLWPSNSPCVCTPHSISPLSIVDISSTLGLPWVTLAGTLNTGICLECLFSVIRQSATQGSSGACGASMFNL